MKLSNLHDMDLWPGVTNLIVSEMVKRSWVLFKIYLSNIVLDSGLSVSFDENIDIAPPLEFDDEVCTLIHFEILKLVRWI